MADNVRPESLKRIETEEAAKAFISEQIEKIKEQVKDGKTGILIEPEDVDDLYRAMDRIASDSSLYMDLCKGAEETLEEISWKQSAKYIIEFINNADQD